MKLVDVAEPKSRLSKVDVVAALVSEREESR
jgi:hypothetical protein